MTLQYRTLEPKSNTHSHVVLLHGWGAHAGIFTHLADALSQHHRVYLVDLPGHGTSPMLTPYTLSQLGTALAHLLPEPCGLIGWSLGGLVAQWMAAHHPAKVQNLTLICSTPKFVADATWPHGLSATVLTRFSEQLQLNFAATLNDFLKLQVRGDTHAAATLTTLQASLQQAPTPSTAALEAGLQLLLHSDLRPHLAQITAPCLVISGEHDRICPPQAGQYLATHLSNSTLQCLRRAGHAPFISHALECTQLILSFLESPHAAA